jgi:hypothetical protein
MANSTLQNELAELRAQLSELKSEREAAAADEMENAVHESPTRPESEETTLDEFDVTALGDRFRELLERLDDGLKDASPTMLLAVFALGVLVGRTLTK